MSVLLMAIGAFAACSNKGIFFINNFAVNDATMLLIVSLTNFVVVKSPLSELST